MPRLPLYSGASVAAMPRQLDALRFERSIAFPVSPDAHAITAANGRRPGVTQIDANQAATALPPSGGDGGHRS